MRLTQAGICRVPAINCQQINQRGGQGMGEAIAYLGLGTNLGDRLAQLGGAIDALGDIGTVGDPTHFGQRLTELGREKRLAQLCKAIGPR